MKVLLCERNFVGHRKIYMSVLARISGVELFCFAPENPGVDMEHYIPYSAGAKCTVKSYCKWIWDIKNVIEKYSIDTVHILDGDSVRKFFGIGFGLLKCKKILITYHHFFGGKISAWAYKGMCRNKNTIVVVHTKSVFNSFKHCGIKNVSIVSYPAFNFESIASRDVLESKRKYNIPTNKVTIGIIGGLVSYKNIIPFLSRMNDCKEKFCLFIAGKESGVTKREIEIATHDYKDDVIFEIRRLTDEEYESAIVASDVVYCLYGKEFDGASGPLTDAVCAQKVILSCSHGSLGQITRENDLGYSADCDNELEIINQTENAIRNAKSFTYSEKANLYRDSLHPKLFREKYEQLYISGEGK